MEILGLVVLVPVLLLAMAVFARLSGSDVLEHPRREPERRSPRV